MFVASRTFAVCIGVLVLWFGGVAVPQFARADFDEGDLQCVPVIQKCGCGTVPCKKGCCGGANKYLCPCKNTGSASGKVTDGICMANLDCVAKSTQGIDGSMQGITDALKLIKDLFGKQGGGGGGGGTGAPAGSTYPPCVRNEATGTVSPIPCTEANGIVNYTGTIGGIIGAGSTTLGTSISDALLDALGEGSFEIDTTTDAGVGSVIDSLLGAAGENIVSATTTSGGTTTIVTKGGETIIIGPGGTEGDIYVSVSGGTIVARSRDPNSNTEVAGFFGGGATTLSQSQSLIGRLCVSRPWSGGLISSIIPATFFDGLCRRGGYQVGALQVTPNDPGAATTKRPSIIITQPNVSTTTPPVPAGLNPVVDIWAEPARVRLGTRTYIFWNTRDVQACTETGPSFQQNSLSGGASTVPLSDSSKFTITCTAADGKTYTDSVTVFMAI